MPRSPIRRNPFDELFVLELANNHLGKIDRGLRIIRDFGRVVRYNNVRAAIKLQIREVETFIHKDFRDRQDIRYIKKTVDTRLPREAFVTFCEAVRRHGCVRMATPFDEQSVAMCEDLDIEILKIASSDLNDWPLIDRIAAAGKPVIASTGGSSLKDMDDLVTFFTNRNLPLALNHCVSLYPSEDQELELNQIDFLRDRYPEITIGFSTHEYHDWETSILIAYAKGARTFERHVDIREEGVPISPYCSTPEQVDKWFKAFLLAKTLCGAPGTHKRIPDPAELQCLDAYRRGVYAARDLAAGQTLERKDFYFGMPLQKSQITSRELTVEDRLVRPVAADEPITIDHLDNVYAANPEMRAMIARRGI